MTEFEKLCEKFGVIETKKRLIYPKQIKFSEGFLESLKNEFLKQLQEDTAPVKDRVAKFTKAIMFHLHELNNTNQPSKVGLAERKSFGPNNARHNYIAKLRSRSKILDALKRNQPKETQPTLKKECNQFQVSVKGDKPTGNKTICLKKMQKRRDDIEKENIENKNSDIVANKNLSKKSNVRV